MVITGRIEEMLVRPKSIKRDNELYQILDGQKVVFDNLSLAGVIRQCMEFREDPKHRIWATRSLNMLNWLITQDSR